MLVRKRALPVEIASAATSVYDADWTVEKMLVGSTVWCTTGIAINQVESVVFKVPNGSVVMGLSIASYFDRDKEMRVEEINADGTVGKELFGWNHCGTYNTDPYKPSDYTPETIVVATSATQFKVSVRQSGRDGWTAGVAIFRPVGIAAS